MADDLSFDFEPGLERTQLLTHKETDLRLLDVSAEDIGQQPGNYKKNFRQTVCTYWLRGLCMKGDACGFLHQYDQERMPVCRTLIKTGVCKELDCPYKHDLEEIKECNMYKLGFCIYGPQCRYKHKKMPGPPPDPSTLEACKPKEYRDINRVVNSVNPGVIKEEERYFKRQRPFYRGRDDNERERDTFNRPLALPAPGPIPGPAPPPGAPPPMLALPPPGGIPPPRPPPGPPPPSVDGVGQGGAPAGPRPPPGNPPPASAPGPSAPGGGQQGPGALDMPSVMPGGMGGHGGMPGMMPGMMPGLMPGMGLGMGPGMGMLPPEAMNPQLLAAFARQFNLPLPPELANLR